MMPSVLLMTGKPHPGLFSYDQALSYNLTFDQLLAITNLLCQAKTVRVAGLI